MAHNFLSDLKKTLDNCIAELDEIHFMFCKNLESDFTRNRRISFRDYIQLLIQMQSKSVSNEILDFYEHSLQNLPLHSRDTNSSPKAGTSCSIHLWLSAALCLTTSTAVTGFWPAMVPMSTYAGHISNTAVTKQRPCFSYKGI